MGPQEITLKVYFYRKYFSSFYNSIYGIKGVSSGHFMYLQSPYSNAQMFTTSIDGPVFQPDQGCYVTFWVDIEGNASVTLIAQNLVTGVNNEIISFSDPSGMFGYTRHVARFFSQAQPFKLFIRGI
jgi:hypothetical protein